MKSEIKKTIEKGLKDHRTKTIRIANKEYALSIFSEDEDINIFEGFSFAEIEDESELTQLKKYRAPVSGYAMRMGLFLYKDKFLIKDYRQNRHILKTIRKVNNTFLKKLKKALVEPDKNTFNKLFDRSDIIEEFYILYKKSREYLLANIKGLSDEDDREVFVDNFMLQMLTLWYLQERGFFNGDRSYFITKFNELKQKKLTGDVGNYYEFLRYFFDKISNNVDRQYHEDKTVGKVVVVGPAIFLNGELDAGSISIPEKCFYKEGVTTTFIDTPPKSVGADVPVLNLFESRDWTEGNIDEFVLGALYEKLITQDVRKKTGAYYTPEVVTSYICENTIEPYLVDRINEKWNMSFESINQIINDGDRKILLSLFEQLKEIKILDPAVGSAHFLESAIDVLLGVYEKIWDRAKELGLRKGLNIVASNRKGEVENFDLLVDVTSREQFRLYVKFFIILSKNIYGVDINRGALKVAKARLFLTLAKHFDANKNLFIRFPNVHFNLRSGNSLIGYVEVMDKPKGQVTIDLFLNEDNVVYVSESIRVVAELEAYLGKTAKALGITGSIVQDIKELNRILSKKSIDWFDFENLLRIKEKLIRILIVSLNTEYAMPLNTLLYEITNLFNEKLNAKFANEHDINPDDLEKIRTFHWLFEFPEVFVDRGGFDVVVGNPPYVSYGLRGVGKLNAWEKDILRNLYNSAEYKIATYPLFIERSLIISRERGYSSLIIPDSFLLGMYFSKIRRFIQNNSEINNILFLPFKVFIGATVGVSVIYNIRKTSNNELRIRNKLTSTLFKSMDDFASNNGEMYRYEQSYFLTTELNRFRLFFNKNDFDIIEYVDKNIENQVKTYLTGHTGVRSKIGQENIISKEHEDDFYKRGLVSSAQVIRYSLFYENDFLNINPPLLNKGGWDENIVEKPKILIRQTGDRIIATVDFQKFYHLNNLHSFSPNNPEILVFLKSLLSIINSWFVTWYYRKTSLEEGRAMAQTDIETIEKLPIPKMSDKVDDVLSLNTEYLLFLNATEERRNELKEMIEFFDLQIADFLVYELYLKEKFSENGLYPEPREYLVDYLSKHLKPINYHRWKELYWKKQLEGNLSIDSEKEFETIDEKNLKIIENIYRLMQNDIQIQNKIEKIRSHPWIKVIEFGRY